MKVSYNGFTGELVKLERKEHIEQFPTRAVVLYDISIAEYEKDVTHSFTNVNLKDVKFLGGSVSFE